MSLFGPPVLVAFQRCNIGPNKPNKTTKFISSGFYKQVSGSSSILSPHVKIIDSAKSKIESVTLGAQKSDVTVDKIPSFPLMNKKKEGFKTSKEGILNIDLLSNPLLRDRYAGIPSVTKILNDTMSEASTEALRIWKQKMIASMGEEKFEAYYKAQMSRGKDFHNKVKDYLMGKSEIENVDPEVSTSFKSLDWVLKDVTNVAAVESFVVHPNLGYKGILDCIAKYKEKPVLIEWKLANKKKSAIASTYDAPLQLCAYLGALNFDKNYNLQVQGGLLVIAHTDGSVADTFEVSMDDCQKFWSQWLSRLEKYYLTSAQQ